MCITYKGYALYLKCLVMQHLLCSAIQVEVYTMEFFMYSECPKQVYENIVLPKERKVKMAKENLERKLHVNIGSVGHVDHGKTTLNMAVKQK